VGVSKGYSILRNIPCFCDTHIENNEVTHQFAGRLPTRTAESSLLHSLLIFSAVLMKDIAVI
jgi:hypothetical protein